MKELQICHWAFPSCVITDWDILPGTYILHISHAFKQYDDTASALIADRARLRRLFAPLTLE